MALIPDFALYPYSSPCNFAATFINGCIPPVLSTWVSLWLALVNKAGQKWQWVSSHPRLEKALCASVLYATNITASPGWSDGRWQTLEAEPDRCRWGHCRADIPSPAHQLSPRHEYVQPRSVEPRQDWRTNCPTNPQTHELNKMIVVLSHWILWLHVNRFFVEMDNQ